MNAINLVIKAISIVGVIVQMTCIYLFIVKRRTRDLSFVFLFLTYLCISDMILLAVAQDNDVWRALVTTTYIGYLFEAAAVWELACALINHSGSKARRNMRRITLGCSLGLLATFLMTSMHSYGAFGAEEQVFLRVDLTVSIYRVLVFTVILSMADRYAFGKNGLAKRVTIVFAAYAVCALLKHAFGELIPRFTLPPMAFCIADCCCSCVWVMLLANLGSFLFRSQMHRSPLRTGAHAVTSI